jgi:hypothetical protein
MARTELDEAEGAIKALVSYLKELERNIEAQGVQLNMVQYELEKLKKDLNNENRN